MYKKRKRYRSRRKERKELVTALLILGLLTYSYFEKFIKALEKKDLYLAIAGVAFLFVAIKLVKWSFKRNKQARYLNSDIGKIDKMDGIEFEHFLLAQFKKIGYWGEVTQASGDYGADLIINKDHEKIVVQAKRYSRKVNLKAVQEVVAALNYFNADHAMVVTNNYYTKSAVSLAAANNVKLWDRTALIELMERNN